MPALDRQAVPVPLSPAAKRRLPPRSVPEMNPTPLQRHYVMLSVVVLLCGAVAITALEFGTPVGSPIVKLCALAGAPILAATTFDAIVRIWRSAWAWLRVDLGRGLFRLVWVVAAVIGLAVLLAGAALIVLA